MAKKAKRRGRPPLAPDQRKETIIRLCITADMKEQLEEAAGAEDMSMSAYIRRLLRLSLDGDCSLPSPDATFRA